MVRSVCPNIFEKDEVKLGVLLALIGGISQKVEDEQAKSSATLKIRGQIHMLLVGEPGTGKS